MSDERHLTDMTVQDWKDRVANFREQLRIAELELSAAERRAAENASRINQDVNLWCRGGHNYQN